MKAYHLTFKSSLHIGTGDDDGNNQTGIEEMLHSDTIYGAVMSSLALLGETGIESYCKEPPVLISSAFPCINGTRFYPVPAGSLRQEVNDNPDDIKFWKKVNYIPEEILLKWLHTGRIDADSIKKNHIGNYTPGGSLRYFTDLERPRLAIDPLTGSVEESRFFYSKDRFFHKGCGLFFIASFRDAAFEKKFNAAMALLSENGLGADRRIGRGHFDYEINDVPAQLKLHNGQKEGLLLSLYFPSEDDIRNGLLNRSRYTLVRRGGYAADFRNAGRSRQALVMLGEGSVLDGTICAGGKNEVVLGPNEDATFSTYRYGTGLIIGKEEVNNG
ncbi:MAG TPA: type III-A CRISPR-associated RAMP protein Csm4 [Spirochaetota bacterium]|nr:type III-A CRISPR-associated RAMP protein Csm4 [Spirochaetota bacterium]